MANRLILYQNQTNVHFPLPPTVQLVKSLTVLPYHTSEECEPLFIVI